MIIFEIKKELKKMYKSYESSFKDLMQEKIFNLIKEELKKKITLLINSQIFVIELNIDSSFLANVYIRDNKDRNIFSIYTHPKVGLLNDNKEILNKECYNLIKDIEKIISDLKEYLFYSKDTFVINIFKL